MSEENNDEVVETKSEVMKVDLWNEEVEVPVELGKKLIAIRDSKTKEYNAVNEQLNSVKSAEEQAKLAKAEAERKAEALEAARNNDVEKAKELLSKEYRDKITRYEAHSYRLAVENAVRSRSDIIDGAHKDIIDAVLLSNQFELGEDFSVKNKSGNSVEELVNNYVDARPHFKLAKGNRPLNTPKNTDKPETQSGEDKFRKGLEKLISD